MSTPTHLHPEAAAVLELPDEERIQFARADRWVGYTRARQIVTQMDDLLVYPKTMRMPNLLLVARADNGKSSIIEHFIGRHPTLVNTNGSPANYILWIAMPAAPTLSSLWSEILWSLLIRHNEGEPAERKRRQAFDAMQYANVRVLAIDEFNHLTNAGKEAGKLLAAIKNLVSALKIPIIASGTQPSIAALNSDPQLKSRFEPAVLDRWTIDVEYRRFLTTYESFLPLPQPSDLAGREMAPKIYGLAGDAIGGTVKLLKTATTFAIQHRCNRIDARLLDRMSEASSRGWEDAAKRA